MKRIKIKPDILAGTYRLKRTLSVLSLLFLSFSILNGQTADFIVSNDEVCEGSAITFTDASTGTTGTVTYVWDFSTGATPDTITGIGPHTITYSTPGLVTVSLTITDDNGSSTVTRAITVNPNATIALTSAAATTSQTICISSPLTLVTYQIAGGGTGATVSGLPAGITGSYSTGVFTISGTPTEPGTFNYTVTTTGTCTQATAAGTINVIALPAANAGSAMTAICQGGTSAPLGGSVGGSAMGGTWSDGGVGGVFNPSATDPNATWTPPASYSGAATLTLTTTGGPCGVATATKTLTVNPLPTANAGPVMAAICQGGTSAPLGGNTGGSATGGIWSDGGVGGTFSPAATDLNATWTPPADYIGTATLTLTTTGGPCGVETDSKTILVNPNATIALTSAAATISQTICVFSPLTPITYQISGGGTGATVSGLPAGITGSYSTGVFTISGTPTVSGTFNYTVTTTGTCAQTTATGTIVVNPLPTANAGPAMAAICQLETSAPLGGGFGGSATGGIWSDGGVGGVFNPSATDPNATWAPPASYSGAATLTLTTTGGPCGVETDSKTILVNPNATIALTSAAATISQTICVFSPLTPITYQISGGGTGATVSGLPAGIIGTYSGGMFTISGTPTEPGTFNYTVTTTGTCTQATAAGTINVIALPATIAVSNSPVCEGTTLTLTGAPNGMTSYSWTGPDGYTSNEQSPIVSANATLAMSGDYTLTVTNSNGCVNSTSTIVEINPLPSATIAGTTTVCKDGDFPVVTFEGSGGTPPYIFTYSINNGVNLQISTTVGNSTSLQVPTGNAGTYVYRLLSVRDDSRTQCSAALTGSGTTATITVRPLPNANISGTTDVCQSASSPNITFTGSVGTAPYTFIYTINSGDPLLITSTGSSVTLPVPTDEPGTFTYSLVSVSDAGTTSCSNSASGSATVTVNALPEATISGSRDVCQDSPSPSVTFTGSEGRAPYTFTYRINSGGTQTVTTTSGSTVSIPVPTSTPGTYDYELISVRDGSTTACAQPQTGSATIVINPLPDATISGSTAVCYNDTPPLITFTGSGGTPPYTFTYTLNSGPTQYITAASGNSVTLPVPTEVTGTFTYSLVSVRDASSTACLRSVATSATVTVNPLPTATISGSADVCQLTSSPQILFTGANGTVPYTFTYTINEGSAQTVTTTGTNNSVGVSVPTATPGTFTYTLLSIQDGSSSSCIQSQSGNAVVNVNPLPEATISGGTSVCRNSTSPPVTFTGSSGTAPYTFTYRINGGSDQTVTSTGNVATVAAPTTTAGVFTYELLSVQDASNTACQQSQGGTAVITVNALPATSVITGNATPTCEAPGETYSVTLTPGSTYAWSVPDGAVITGGATGPGNNSITVDFGNSNGNISVTETNANGCTGEQVSLAISLQGCDLNPNFTVSNTSVCSGSSVVFTDLSSGITEATTYNWNFGAGATPATANTSDPHTVTYTGSGQRTVSLTLRIDGFEEVETKTDYITINPIPTATISGAATVCEGSEPPLVRFTGSLGTAPYTFTYTINGGAAQTVTTSGGNSATVQAPTGTPGSFIYRLVSVSDGTITACARPLNSNVIVRVNPLPSATMTGSTTVCMNDTPPLITFTGSDGTTPYTFTYRVNGGAARTVTTAGSGSTVTVPVPTPGAGIFTYELLTVRDASSTTCERTGTDIAVVTVNPLPTATISGTATVCSNSPSPNITFTGAGGTPPYIFTYTINGGAPQLATSVAGSSVNVPAPTATAGTYVYELVRVEDASESTCGQIESGDATITVLPLPTATITGNTEVCKDDVSPVVTFRGADGVVPYTFTYTVNGGNYQTVTTTSGNSVTIPVPTGTVGSYNYELVSVRDGGSISCSQAQTGSALITVNPLPVAAISGSTVVCQNAEPPVITFTGSNGMAPYTFTYEVNSGDPQTIISTGNTATISVPTDVAGVFTYALVSVYDASSTRCEKNYSGTATVRVNPLPEATISGTTAVCKDDLPPEITFAGFNGTLPYTFTYTINGSNPQTITTSGGSSVRVSVPTVIAGVYEYELVSVRDGSSTHCVNIQDGSATITVNPLPQAMISGTASVCQSGPSPTIRFTGSNGTAPYTFIYSINSGDPLTVTTSGNNNSITVQAPTDIVGSFTYALLNVSDGSSTSCDRSVSGTATITVLSLPTATIGGTTAVCRNAPSPGVTFTGYTGVAPYTFIYRINGGALTTVTAHSGNSVTVPAPTATAGVFDYELVSVSDASAQACSQTQTGSAVITVNPLPEASITGTTAVCQFSPEPVITFTGSEGTAPYTFTYNVNGGGNQSIVSTGNSAVVSVPTNLAGIFSFELVSIRDASSTGCSQPVTGNATVTVNQLPTATITGSVDVCQSDPAPQILFTGAAGMAPYTFTYRINGGGIHTVSTTGSNSSVGVPVSTATPGTFSYELISVRDGSSSLCLQAQTGSAVVRVNPLSQANISGTTQVCRSAPSPPVTFTGSGGTAPYTFTYSISGGSEQAVTSTGNVAVVNAPTTTAGVFTYELLTVQDASSTACEQAQVGEVIITVNELPVTSAIAGNATPPCEANGQIYSVTLTPGSTYLWSVPDGALIVSGATGPANNTITVNFGTSNGNVSVTETNASGCAGTTISLPINLQGCALSPNFTVSNTSVCSGSSVIFTDLSSGTSPSTTYLWNFGTGAVPATANTAGPHTVTYTGSGQRSVRLTITDGNTETALKSNYITVNPLPSATITGTTAVCEGSTAPLILFTGAGGTSPYTFTYTINGGSEETVTTMSGSSVSVPAPTTIPGSYIYRLTSVRDGSSTACERSITGSSATVTVNPLPSASMTGTTTVCRLDDSPLITFTGSGGSAPYTFTYRINGGAAQTVTTSGTSNSVTIPVSTLAVGIFTYELISVRDGSSTACEQPESDIAIVTVNPLPTASITGTTAVCRDSESPNITFTGSGGTPPYIFTYTINSGASQTVTTVVGSSVTVPVSTTTEGAYTYALLSVQDRGGTGCSQVAGGGATVTVNPLPTATLTGTTVVCEGDPAPPVTFTGANGTEPYIFTYRLNGGNYQTIAAPTGNSVTISVPTGVSGTYSYELVSVRDASSTACSQEQTGLAVVTVNPRPTATISGTATVCQNSAGTMVTFTGSNGTSPYTFTYNINSGATRTVTTAIGESSVSVPVPTGATGLFTYSLMMVRDASSTACGRSISGSATITVLPLPTATISGTTTVCAFDSYPEITFTGAAGSAPYTFIYNINGGGDLSVTSTSAGTVSIPVPTETAGEFRYELVAVIDGSSNSCSNEMEGEAIVTIRALPTATLTGGGTFCHNDAPPEVTFTGSGGVAPYTFVYTRNGGTPVTVTTSSGNSVTVQVPTDTPDSFEYLLLGVSDAGSPNCSQAHSGTALFTINPLPQATISGNNVVCRDDPEPEISFRGSEGSTPYTFTYRINGGEPLTVSTEPGRSNITITAPTATAGDYIYELISVRDGSVAGCSQQQAGSIQITVDEIPVANAGSDSEVCGPVFRLDAIPDIGSGIWSMVSGTGSASFSPSIDDPNAVVTVTTYGLKEFTWTEFNGVCSDDATIEVMFWEMPVVNAGTDGESCDLRFGLNATPGIGAGRWRMTRGGGTATFYPDAFDPNAVVEVSQYGQKDFTWTEVNGTCTASDIVEVIFNRQPVANPGSGGNNCGRIFNLRATPSYGTGTWTVVSGPGNAIFTPGANSPTAAVEVDEYGTYEFRWTEVNGSCSDFGSIDVTFIEAIPANGGEGGIECDLDFVFDATPITNNGFWSKLSGPGAALFDPSHDNPDATVTVDQYGTYEFGWTELNVVCQSTDIVVVEFHEIPAVSTIEDTVICRGGSVELMTLGEGNFLWAPVSFLDSTEISSPSAIPDSTLQYIVTLTDQYGCTNKDTVVITVMEQPVANAGPDQSLDYSFNTQLQATLGANETGTWSIVSGDGTFSDTGDPQTMINGLSLGDNLLQWIVSNGVCPESADQVTILVNDLIIPTLITPNGDQMNEYFELRGIETLGVTELIIFDRGGTQVYRSSNYGNDWNGVDQHGNPLPEDTYFFVMKPRNGQARSGYIVIRR